MRNQSSYRCPCGAQVVWTSGVVTGECVNGVRRCRRDAACPDCRQRYRVRVACNLLSPLRLQGERWFALDADDAERLVVLAHVGAKHPAHV